MNIDLSHDELIVDCFAGGGGASQAIFQATGRHPDVAINHDPEAVAMHAANHPTTRHFCKSIYQVDPDDIIREYKRPIGLAWFSPDCTHHSKARGGKPKEKHIRDLAWTVVHWAERAVYQGQRPRVIFIENVEEFIDWGDLDEHGQPIADAKGRTFVKWATALRKLGYKVEWKELRACDYGAPTIRKRLFIVARCDGKPIVWPKPTHGAVGTGLPPYRTAAECIDWSVPAPSIFDRKKPLAENTLRRVAKGTKRYTIDAKQPFIVNLTHHGSDRIEAIDEPFKTITGANRGEKAVATPTLIQMGYGEAPGQQPRVPGLEKPLGTVVAGGGKHGLVTPNLIPIAHYNGTDPVYDPEKPMNTITATPKGGSIALVSTHITKFRTGAVGSDMKEPLHTITAGGKSERPAGAPHAMGMLSAHLAQHNTMPNGGTHSGRSVDEPVSTVTATGSQQGLVTAQMARLFGSSTAASVENPLGSVTSKEKDALVTASIAKYRGENVGHAADDPLHTISAGGIHHGLLAPHMVKYYGCGEGAAVNEPCHTVTGKDRFGLVVEDIQPEPLTEEQWHKARLVADLLRRFECWDDREIVTITIGGLEWVIVDIGLRMLTPPELYAAQGFPSSYIIDQVPQLSASGDILELEWKPLTKTAQVRMCGNSVSPPPADALIYANLSGQEAWRVAA